MTEKRRLGDRGEDYTARYLQKQGYTITGPEEVRQPDEHLLHGWKRHSVPLQ